MHTIGGLDPHPAAGPIDHVGGDLLTSMSGEAVQEHGSVLSRAHQPFVDLEPLEGTEALITFGLLAHRRPHVGVDHVGPTHRLDRDDR